LTTECVRLAVAAHISPEWLEKLPWDEYNRAWKVAEESLKNGASE
jgi:hypothetical protein